MTGLETRPSARMTQSTSPWWRVQPMLAGDHLVPLRPQRAHHLVEARAIGPEAMAEDDARLALRGHARPFGRTGVVETQPHRRRRRSLESCDCFSPPMIRQSGSRRAAPSAPRRRTLPAVPRVFGRVSTPTVETAGIPKLANCVLGCSTVNQARAVCVLPDDRSQWRIEHGAGVVAEHLLRDRDVAHEIGDAVVLVVRELHHAVDVVAPVDEKSVWGQLGVRVDDLGPARLTRTSAAISPAGIRGTACS